MLYTIIVARERQEARRGIMEDEMTTLEFKTIMEMVITIIESSETKEEALEKLKNLSIVKEN